MRHSHSLWNSLLQQPLVFPSAIVLWMLSQGKKPGWCWGTLLSSFVHLPSGHFLVWGWEWVLKKKKIHFQVLLILTHFLSSLFFTLVHLLYTLKKGTETKITV